MRLSEAILAGSVLVRPAPGVLLVDWHDGKRGCALGMACEAVGLQAPANQLSLAPIYDYWPWMMTYRLPSVSPCCGTELYRCNASRFITHVFDYHIAVENPLGGIRWTLEQLCDWIRSVEPAEDAEPARLHLEREHADSGTGPVIHEHASETV